MKVYLAGGIYEVEDPKTWRREFTKLLPTAWEALDPTEFEPSYWNPRETIALDLRMILSSNIMFARATKPSWGTAMEIAFAHNHRIPVIAWVADPNGSQSLWLRAHTDLLVSSPEKAISMLSELALRKKKL